MVTQALLACAGIWHNNMLACETLAILPYDQVLQNIAACVCERLCV